MMKWLLLLLCFVGYISAFTASAGSKLTIKSKTPIEIGAIYNLTGDQSPLDITTLRGAQLAVSQLNLAGGILGRPVKLLLKDGRTQPKVIQRVAAQLANNHHVTFVIGLSDNDMAMTAATTLTQHHKIFITSGATSPALAQHFPAYYYMIACADHMQAAAAAQFILQRLHQSTVLVVYDGTMGYTHDLASYFIDSYQHFGGQVVNQLKFAHDQLSEEMIDKIKQSQANAIYFAAGPSEAISMLKKMRLMGVKQPIIGGDSYTAYNLTQADVNNVYYTTHGYVLPSSSDSKMKMFLTTFHQKYHQDPSNVFAGLGYDSVMLIAHVIETTKSADDASLLNHQLANLTSFDGVMGQIAYRPGFTIPQKAVTIIEINDRKATLAAQITPSYVPPIADDGLPLKAA